MVAKGTDERYALTTFGLNQILKEIIPRIRNKV
jgi:hypothetical protein